MQSLPVLPRNSQMRRTHQRAINSLLPRNSQMRRTHQRAIDRFSEMESTPDTFRSRFKNDARGTNRKNTTERPTFNPNTPNPPEHHATQKLQDEAGGSRGQLEFPEAGPDLQRTNTFRNTSVLMTTPDKQLRSAHNFSEHDDNRTYDVKLTDTYNCN